MNDEEQDDFGFCEIVIIAILWFVFALIPVAAIGAIIYAAYLWISVMAEYLTHH